MKVVLEMTLPRDAGSAPLARHTLDASLRGLGVASEVRADIALALGEACANVIQHAEASREYEVRARMDGLRCVVDVIDGGRDGAPDVAGAAAGAPLTAEHGRGLQLIRSFTEELRIMDRRHKNGAIVHFEKSLAG
ncbi:ATP-binding protein [Actinomadura parmotrematis]|uniref:ATP-binding protein n=1 Tax=Actinomadura parmotrematis TaxID=2864039 RepID=A0ABS7FQL5_9ACTN|nr:ATP-binding protein [Actinomadura parmotrematis]MBW8482019.1 ATP-binding protein [Actinomadura parmotrematis]